MELFPKDLERNVAFVPGPRPSLWKQRCAPTTAPMAAGYGKPVLGEQVAPERSSTLPLKKEGGSNISSFIPSKSEGINEGVNKGQTGYFGSGESVPVPPDGLKERAAISDNRPILKTARIAEMLRADSGAKPPSA